MRHDNKRNIRWALGGTLVVLSLMATAGLHFVEPAEGADPIKTNEAGLSYGPVEGFEQRGQYPDLIAVQATNGNKGYILREDEERAAGVVSTPEEAIAFATARKERLAASLKDAMNEQLPPGEGISLAEALEITAVLQSTPPATAAPQALGILSESAEEKLSEEAVLTAYEKALKEDITYIPVYEADGVTQVGVYPIG